MLLLTHNHIFCLPHTQMPRLIIKFYSRVLNSCSISAINWLCACRVISPNKMALDEIKLFLALNFYTFMTILVTFFQTRSLYLSFLYITWNIWNNLGNYINLNNSLINHSTNNHWSPLGQLVFYLLDIQ